MIPTGADPSQNILTWEVVRRHVTADSCWLVVGDRVFDVTTFLDWHPAGRKTILRVAGTDVTEHFAFHSSKAKRVWAQLEIGRLPENKPKSSCTLQ